jgi:phosphatidylglycerol:prolipoprotein diacylglycerol transferase
VIPLVITMPLDPVLQLGPIPVHWYGLGYAVAFLVGYRLIVPFATKRGISEQTVSNAFWLNIGIGLVAARLYFVIQQPDLSVFVHNPIRIIAVWEGGMAFFGAVIACPIALVVMAYRKKLPVWVILDGAAIFATLPQAIGRLGNVINGDILGPQSNLPWAVRYTSPHTFAPQVGVAYQPAGAYELLASLALFGVVMFVIGRGTRDGIAWIVYLAGYATSQFLLFFVRATEPVVLFGLKQAQLTSLVILLVVVPAFTLARQRYPHIFRGEGPAVDAGEGGGPEEELEEAASTPAPERRRNAGSGLAQDGS